VATLTRSIPWQWRGATPHKKARYSPGFFEGNQAPKNNRYRCSLSGLAGLAALSPPGFLRRTISLPPGGLKGKHPFHGFLTSMN